MKLTCKKLREKEREIEELKEKLRAANAEKRACFRLGQMDMRQAAVDALMELASKQSGSTRSTLMIGADLIRELDPIEHG